LSRQEGYHHIKKRKRRIGPLLIFLVLLLAGVCFALGYILDPARLFSNDPAWAVDAELAGQFSTDRINIALLGFDRDEARDQRYSIYRPDTIMIAAIDFKNKDVSVVNIPRDSYVKIHGTDIYDKINHSYMYGHQRSGVDDPHRSGIENTLKTIQDFLGGIPIHYYVALDMDNVKEIVDSAGGFYYDVDVEVRTDYGRGSLLLEKGYQHLDGQKFLYYVRDRGTGGDVGRAQRQQRIVIAFFQHLKKNGRLQDVPELYKTVKDNMKTNLSIPQIASLALFGYRVDTENIETYVFAGSGQYAPRGGMNISYYVIDEKDRVELIEKVFGVMVPEREQIVLPGPAPTYPVIPDPQPVPEPAPQPQPGLQPDPVPEPEPGPRPEEPGPGPEDPESGEPGPGPEDPESGEPGPGPEEPEPVEPGL
jgi:LCP family protein required for cell wall assembly